MDLKSPLVLLVLLIITGGGETIPQQSSNSNYGIQGNDVEYNLDAPYLPSSVTLAGKVTEFDDLKPQIVLNRTTGILNCADGSMKIDLLFKEKFYGIAYSDFDRNSACYVQGTGNLQETLELPLKGCGTKQDPARVFTNNVIVRFHPGLEMEGDEVITIVCRYPPPIVPLPPAAIIQPPYVAPVAIPAQLKEFEILLIICAILFLGLTLLGLGCSYYCLKQRNIQVIRKRPFTPIEEELSERLSSIESFANLKIPRVHAPSIESSSEAPLEETLASDYPSSIEDAPHRPDTVSSEYSDTHARVEIETIPPLMVRKPQFEVNLRVATQPEALMQFSQADGSITSFEEGQHAFSSRVSELHDQPRRQNPPTVFSKVQEFHEPTRSVQNTEIIDSLTVIDRENVARETRYTHPMVVRKPIDREDVARETRYTQPMIVRKPEVSVHTVDDVYLQTIVERRLIEDEERRTREVTQFYKKEHPKWDVVITSHTTHDDDTWERGSETTDVASSIGWSTVEEPPIRPHYSVVDRDLLTRRTDISREINESTSVSRAMQKLQESDTHVWNEKWKVLLRVLESPTRNIVDPHHESDDNDYDSETASVLTEDDREKWRQIITKESTLRSLLTQATVREDYERIRRDTRYEKLFEPEKWDVIIRVLAPPERTAEDDRFYSDSTSEVSSFVSASYPQKPRRALRKKSSDTAGERKSITDVRSMTEVMVDFATNDFGRDDDSSVVSSIRGGRSVADRSQTEIVEFAPLDEEDSDSTLGGSDILEQHGNNSTSESRRHDMSTNAIPRHGGISNRNFSTEEHNISRHMAENSGGFVRESSAKTTYTSSRQTRH